jgi:formylmethanofuran dehydrogenase subunit D
MEMNPDAALELGVAHGSYARLVSRRGHAVVLVQCTQRVPRDKVFIPFHFHECVNRVSLGLLDPYSRQPAFKQCAIRVEAIEDQQAASLIAARHGLRGLLYVWPLVLLLFVDFPGIWNGLRLLLLGLGVAAWFRFICRSVEDDPARFVAAVLLEPGDLRRIL